MCLKSETKPEENPKLGLLLCYKLNNKAKMENTGK